MSTKIKLIHTKMEKTKTTSTRNLNLKKNLFTSDFLFIYKKKKKNNNNDKFR